MPYIKSEEQRMELENSIEHLICTIKDEGDLNFTITTLISKYVKEKGKNYATLNTVLGVLSAVTMEFYHRTVRPYEEIKIEENGDIRCFED